MYRMYMVSPVGKEEATSVVISRSGQEAESRAREAGKKYFPPNQKFTVIDLTSKFDKNGYYIEISTEMSSKSVYH